MIDDDLKAARDFVNVCETMRTDVVDVRWMLGTSSGGEYVARLRVGGQPFEGTGETLYGAVASWLPAATAIVSSTAPAVSESDHVAVRAFVDECERGRGKVDRLWWMIGLANDGQRFVARVQLAKVIHQGDGASLADAINALGTKLLALGKVARKR